MFRLGWQVFRTRSGDALDAARVRRAVWISAIVAVVALAGLVVLQVAFGWAGHTTVRPVVVIALIGTAVGLVLFACFPIASAPDPAATINGRQVRPDERLAARDSVQQYFGRREPTVTSADREAVLTDVPLVQRALVRRIARFGPVWLGMALLATAALLFGGHHGFAFVWMFAYVVSVPGMVVQLGRAERARLAALAVPPFPDGGAPSADRRRRDPLGSKIRLPGE
ncbi:hypothetical protein [Curtobacterium pusillum]|uniref:hypothetical protein n=1 Tax=Curtobacterium pusillum TaxID=69373 RepID=UPI0011A71F92|nr:hypothetical protein [Curtobacterium pusillum]